MVRELTKAEQARGALVGTPGSTHARHSNKPPKEYGPGFYGSKKWTLGFWLATVLVFAAFIGFIVYEETRPEQHHDEQQQDDPTTNTPGSDDGEETLDTSGTAMGADPASTRVPAL